MDKRTKSILDKDPEFYSRISNMRKIKSGGKTFADKEAARAAQRKSVEARKRNAKNNLVG